MQKSLSDDWIQTFSGKHFYVMNPTEDMICLEDIAHALGNVCRFAGHCGSFYSVAEHSVWVSELVESEHKIAALFHDASEAYIADIARPFKPFFENYKTLEDNIMRVIASKFGFDYPLHRSIHEADNAQLKIEAKYLLTDCNWADEIKTKIRGVPPWGFTPNEAENLFLNAYKQYLKGNADAEYFKSRYPAVA
jgi:hypothetical protein